LATVSPSNGIEITESDATKRGVEDRVGNTDQRWNPDEARRGLHTKPHSKNGPHSTEGMRSTMARVGGHSVAPKTTSANAASASP